MGDVDLGAHNVMALNHVVGEMPVDVAHIIDLDVVEACADRLVDNCRWLVMPRVPHVRLRNSLRLLDDFIPVIPALRELDEQGRLVWYNTDVDRTFAGSPVVYIRYFSSEAALTILAELGARTVRTLGIDGGQSYSSRFEEVAGGTRLVNRQPSFDLQFPELQRIATQHGMEVRPVIEPIRIFVGTEDNQMPAARVLEYTIRQNTKHPVRVEFMQNYAGPMPKARKNRPRTTFSFCRLQIPGLCNYEGRAIYMDADMQVFGDVEELWTRPFDEHRIMVTRQDEPPAAWQDSGWFHPGRQMSVMVLDCSRLDWHVPEIINGLDADRYSYEDLMFNMCLVGHDEIDDTLPPEWNHLERYEPGVTKLTHFTVVPTQPWKNDENPLCGLWRDAFGDAVAAGAIDPDEVESLVARGEIKASLLEALNDLPVPRFPATSVADVELDAAFQRLDELEARGAKGKALALLRRLRPRADRVRKNDGRVGLLVDRVVRRVRRAIR
ncbi:MAG TPA: glycosyltransferase [Acidimicrobiia bacterium]|nr:glycosyltransferase [Acidimicrobiia bacterium]